MTSPMMTTAAKASITITNSILILQVSEFEVTAVNKIKYYYYYARRKINIILYIISESAVALYVRLAHDAPTTQYKTFMALSATWHSEGSTSAMSSGFHSQENFPVAVSSRKVAEQRSIIGHLLIYRMYFILLYLNVQK